MLSVIVFRLFVIGVRLILKMKKVSASGKVSVLSAVRLSSMVSLFVMKRISRWLVRMLVKSCMESEIS